MRRPIGFRIFVQDGFAMLALSLVTSAIEAANRLTSSQVYRWSLFSLHGGRIVSDTGVCFDTDDAVALDRGWHLSETGRDLILICAVSAQEETRRRIGNWCRKTAAHGGRVVAIGGASEVLADQGLLRGRRCAVHWRDYAVLAERHPSVRITRHFFEIDGPFHTSPGELATFDLMLRMVEEDCGSAIAERIASHSLPGNRRAAWDRQAFPDVAQLERVGSPLVRIVEKMEDHVADPLPLRGLIDELALSRRQVERHFVSQFGMSPMKFYLQVRLERARQLVRHSSMQVVEIAVATGFVSASHFSKSYRVAFGESPTDTRRSDLARNSAQAVHDDPALSFDADAKSSTPRPGSTRIANAA